MIFSLIVGILVCIFLYNRYFPVVGISALQSIDIHSDSVLLDLRDYQTTAKEQIPDAINIPYAYLNRYYLEIPNKKLLIIATDSIEKNLAIRFLKKRKFVILGFIICDRKRSDKQWSMTSKQKTG
ncbi:MAG: sulfurtransferase [Bacillus sp. (in: Bacteria)]|nr:sulfurtransferase [Bacillus sp. (in: firmicutes)]